MKYILRKQNYIMKNNFELIDENNILKVMIIGLVIYLNKKDNVSTTYMD